MNVERCWLWIVKKDGQYLKSAVNGVPKWSNNKSDAALIELFTDAIKVAERVNGGVRRFNTMTYEVK
jgi:hypothetical protein